MFLYYLDTNECLPDSPCRANATCNNTEGSYICTCDSGYSGDGFTCNGRILMRNINIREPGLNIAVGQLPVAEQNADMSVF
jgi:hypothetical protein